MCCVGLKLGRSRAASTVAGWIIRISNLIQREKRNRGGLPMGRNEIGVRRSIVSYRPSHCTTCIYINAYLASCGSGIEVTDRHKPEQSRARNGTPHAKTPAGVPAPQPRSSASLLRFMSRVTRCWADSCLASSCGTFDTGLFDISARVTESVQRKIQKEPRNRKRADVGCAYLA